jgi:hypothetical protein
MKMIVSFDTNKLFKHVFNPSEFEIINSFRGQGYLRNVGNKDINSLSSKKFSIRSTEKR